MQNKKDEPMKLDSLIDFAPNNVKTSDQNLLNSVQLSEADKSEKKKATYIQTHDVIQEENSSQMSHETSKVISPDRTKLKVK